VLQPPIVVIHGRQFGFSAYFHVALAHRLLYMCRPHLLTPQLQPNASQVCRVSWRSLMAQTLCDDRRLQPSESGRVGRRRPAPPPSSSTVAGAATWHASSASSCPTAPCGRQACARSSLLPPSVACAS
jgi:hypothetical protein